MVSVYRRRPKNRLLCQSFRMLDDMASALITNSRTQSILPDECGQFMDFVDTSDKNNSAQIDQSAWGQLCQMRRQKIATELQVLHMPYVDLKTTRKSSLEGVFLIAFDLLALPFVKLRAANFAISEAEACGAIVDRIITHEQARLARLETQTADIKAAKVRSLSDLDAAA